MESRDGHQGETPAYSTINVETFMQTSLKCFNVDSVLDGFIYTFYVWYFFNVLIVHWLPFYLRPC